MSAVYLVLSVLYFVDSECAFPSRDNVSMVQPRDVIMPAEQNQPILDTNKLSIEIERLTKQKKSDEKVQKLLRLEGMIEPEIKRLNVSSQRYAEWKSTALREDTIRAMELKNLLQIIRDHMA